MRWKTRRSTHDLSVRGMVMGILNVTPDSFSDGGKHADPEAALAQAESMIRDGADIIDVGGESTRPGADPVGEADEIGRVVPVIEALRTRWDGLISIDTMKAEVAREALKSGADIVNDVSGLTDPVMVEVCAEFGCGVVVMHMKGQPRTMQVAPSYDDVVAEVREFFEDRLADLSGRGIDPACLCFDPGIGFGKSLEHNLELLRALPRLQVADRPLLVGLSRKSFIGKLLGSERIEDREAPTVALTAWTRENGARIHRVHEVRPNREALRMAEAILHGVAAS